MARGASVAAGGSPYRVVKSERVYSGRVLDLRVDTLDVGSGKRVKREIAEHRGAVVMAPLDRRGRLVMVRQYRHAAGKRLLELPAGTLEPGEEPKATALRELREETGYEAGSLKPFGGFYSAPGFTTEYLHFFIARRLRPAPSNADEDEDIQVEAVPLRKARELVRSGGIQDAKSIAGLYLLQLALGR